MPQKTGVLFVCLGAAQAHVLCNARNLLHICCGMCQICGLAGNICRSPTAEAVFRAVVEKAGRADRFLIDSCGTGGGNPDW